MTVPALPDAALWDAYPSVRQTLSGDLSGSRPAGRYLRTPAAR